MISVNEWKEKIIQGEEITKETALELYNAPLEELCKAADEIREHFCKNGFDMCTIINGKSGKCSENCKYCAQSAHYHTASEEYPLLDTEEIVRQAKYNADRGVVRYSIVTSGKALNDTEIEQMCEAIRAIKREVDIEVCVSFGLLNEAQFRKVKEAGVTRVHNNLETSRNNFPNVCTTHNFEDKVAAIRAAKAAGLAVCSGGIMGLGETVEDRIDMAFSLKELGVRSVPVNMLNPIPGTPYEKNQTLTIDDMRRIVAIYRFILPEASIRLAGGRGLLEDKGEGCFQSGANAVISGDMLTTAGYTIESDMAMLKKLGYQIELCNG
jgi:biotin synthase